MHLYKMKKKNKKKSQDAWDNVVPTSELKARPKNLVKVNVPPNINIKKYKGSYRGDSPLDD